MRKNSTRDQCFTVHDGLNSRFVHFGKSIVICPIVCRAWIRFLSNNCHIHTTPCYFCQQGNWVPITQGWIQPFLKGWVQIRCQMTTKTTLPVRQLPVVWWRYNKLIISVSLWYYFLYIEKRSMIIRCLLEKL